MELALDILQAENFRQLRGKRIGLMTNPSAVDSKLESAYDILRQAEGFELVAFFGAEHGVKASVADGESIHSSIDLLTGLPVYSLYGDYFRPSPEMLAGIDLMLCDIQDIGARYYTFLWTITHILEACGELGIPVLLLDRPNPLAGKVLGRGVDSGFSSLVGRYNIPIQHGLSLGEMLSYINDKFNPHPAQFEILTMRGWQRKQFWHETGLAFVPPSPNMPHALTAYHYVGSCLIEGTNLSEGRGTSLPFEIVGAPWLDSARLARDLNALNFAGIRFRPHSFRPTASKYQGQVCEGVQAHITDLSSYDPLTTWLGVIRLIRHQYPEHFTWLSHFERLIGTDKVRLAIDRGDSLAEIMGDWGDFARAFQQETTPYLRYE